MNADLVVYEMLAKAILQRVLAEEDGQELHRWLSDQVARIGGAGNEDAVMTWPESFDFYDDLLTKRAEYAAMPESERKTLEWKWRSWRNLIDPLEPGMLAVITAGDGMGKTIYAESLAEHWAAQRNHVVFVHYELNRALMMDRRTARHTSITRRELKGGRLTPEQLRVVNEVRPRLLKWDGHITYVHTPGWNMERTIQELQRLRAEGECDVVVLDYLEKASASTRQLRMFGSNVYQREADNVEQLKTFAESTEIPVVMLAQMSKAGKQQGADTMDRTDMRGAGDKSEKANIVVLLNRKRLADGYSNTVDVRVDKNTLGQTGQFQQYMQPEYFKVEDIQG